MLIELTTFDLKQSIILNTDLIESIYPLDGSTKIITINNKYHVLESYKTVESIISNRIKIEKVR